MTTNSLCLTDYVSINKQFYKSVRIDTDIADISALDSYVSIRETVYIAYKVLKDVREKTNIAFTLTGPYGSGKSSLALVVSSFIDKKSILHNRACDIVHGALSTDDYSQIKDFVDEIDYRSINLSAKSQSLREAIVEALGCKKTEENIKNALELLKQKIKKEKLFIIADEFGHFLDKAFNDKDIIFIQNIAELASRSQGNFVFVGILHQSFEAYVTNQSEAIKTEWSKIQGRFENISLIPNPVSTLELIAQSIVHKHSIDALDFTSLISAVFVGSDSCEAEKLKQLFNKLYPLHPLTGIVLASFAKKPYGQNERSVFSFLASNEFGSFGSFIKKFNFGEFYSLYNLFDYIKNNFEYQILSSLDSHTWATVNQTLSVLERGCEKTDIDVYKSIACINLFAEHFGILATKEVICSCFDVNNEQKVKEALGNLVNKRAVIYRKFNNSYSLFDGSDFVLSKALRDELDNVKIDFKLLDNYLKNNNIYSAKEHYFTTGTLRWLELHIVEYDQLSQELSDLTCNNECIGHFVIVLSDSESVDIDAFIKNHSIPEYIALGCANNSAEIVKNLKKFIALESLKKLDSVQGDKIARREIESHQHRVAEVLSESLNSILYNTDLHTVLGVVNLANYNNACRFASQLAEHLYPKTIHIINELINKNKVSANITHARKVLMQSMVDHGDKADLDFTGTPPELCIYRSLLLAKGVHGQCDDIYSYTADGEKLDKQIAYLYEFIKDSIINSKDHSISVSKILDLLSAAPIGLKNGPAPILLLSFILSHNGQITVYDMGYLIVSYDISFIETFLAYPENLTIKWYRNIDNNDSIVRNIKKALENIGASRSDSLEPLFVARDLVNFIFKLPALTQSTNMVSKEAVRLKTKIKNAVDPIDLLLKQVPELYTDIDITDKRLTEALVELKSFYPNTIKTIEKILYKSLDLEVDSEGKLTDSALSSLLDRVEIVKNNKTTDRLVQFSVRLEMIKGNTQAAIEGIISLICEKAQKDWVDSSIYLVIQEVQQLSYDFRRSECFYNLDVAKKNNRYLVSVIFNTRNNGELLSSFDVDQTKLDESQDEINKIINILKSKDRETALAILSEIGIRLDKDGH